MNFYHGLEKYYNNIAVVTEQSECINYKGLLGKADKIRRQIKKRCLVFTICKNNFESIAGYLGLLHAGAVQVLIDDSIDDLLLTNLLSIYKPDYVYRPEEKTGGKKYRLIETNYNIDYNLHPDIALLLTTSGSTGSPKMVRLSYKNLASNAEAIAQYLSITSADRPITTMPMSYSYGLSIINSHLLMGASIILTESTLMDRHFWTIINKNSATTFGGVPYIYEMLKKLRFEKIDLPDLKYITQAGGKLSPQLSAEFSDICARKSIKFYVMYGQTEATARMSYLPWEFTRQKGGSIGIPIPGGQFWLEDDNGNIINENDVVGELIYRGPNVSLGYAENRFDLAKGDENKCILRTGDIAKRDEDGFYYVVGRKKRFLKIFGKRINLNEVEQLVMAEDCECACAGTDDNLMIYMSNPAAQDRIKNYIIKHLGINKSGFTLVCIDKIPRNKSGKVLYKALEEVGNNV